MKYLVAPGGPLLLGGVRYAPGDPVEIFGHDQASFFGARLVPITDPVLIRSLEVNSHPFCAVDAFRYGRQDYVPGDILFLATRAQARSLGSLVRPASGEEVIAWVQAREARDSERRPRVSEPEEPKLPKSRTKRQPVA